MSRIDIFYRLKIGGSLARDLRGHEWVQAHDCQHSAVRCPPIGVDVDICEMDADGLLEGVAVGHMISQTWHPGGHYVFCVLEVDELTADQRETLGIALEDGI